MTSHEILKADVLDILFDNRNKMYGAYELRRHYNNRMYIALSVMSGIVLLGVLLVRTLPDDRLIITNPFERNNTVIIREVDIKIPEPELPQPPPRATRPVAQTSHTTIDIVPDDIVDKTVPDQATLINTNISTVTTNGDPANNAHQQPESIYTGSGIEEKKPEPEKNFGPVERSAQFPGGQQAWMAFLSKHLRTPDELEAGQKRTVLVRFSVGADGSISNFDVIQSGGSSFDSEVIRVLRKMPKWTPAYQNGHSVSVIFTQPVTFMAFED